MESAVVAEALRRRGVAVGAGARFFGRPLVTVAPRSTLDLGARFVAISRSRDTALGVAHPVVLRTMRAGAVLRVGADVGMSGGTICVAGAVEIGDGCLLGADVTIVDTDFHSLSPVGRRYAAPPEPQPHHRVVLGTGVFVGKGAVILKGSAIGDHAVVGAGAVVTGTVAPYAIVAGNPARPVGSAPGAGKLDPSTADLSR